MLIKSYFQINRDVARPASVHFAADTVYSFQFIAAPHSYIPSLHQKDQNIKNKKAANKNTTWSVWTEGINKCHLTYKKQLNTMYQCNKETKFLACFHTVSFYHLHKTS